MGVFLGIAALAALVGVIWFLVRKPTARIEISPYGRSDRK